MTRHGAPFESIRSRETWWAVAVGARKAAEHLSLDVVRGFARVIGTAAGGFRSSYRHLGHRLSQERDYPTSNAAQHALPHR